MDSALAEAPRARLIDLEGRGGAMAVLDFGDPGRPVDIVFVHANGFNARTYRSILGPLADDLRILAVDQRGHGRSTLPAETEGRTSWDGLRDDLLTLLATLDLRDVVLSGHSMGGTACVLAQAQAPERVRRVVLFDPVVMPSAGMADPGQVSNSPLVQGALRRRSVFPDKAAVVAAYTGRGAFKTWSGETLADYVADGFRERDDGQVELSCAPEWEASNFSSHAHDTWGAFEQAQVPIRILRAAEGSTCREDPKFDALVAAGRIEVETVPGTTHFLPMERPDLVRSVLRSAAS
ncbi:hydrolase [Phenylobacterium sp. Root77]|uniref:alpha/beta fold hydrolase n=1 Tax=unclassified Phenylobacterium TaxID=2640670 RepID=UPI0006F7DF38|nr:MULTISPECIES: alpha/beta hydrolase [unclassified Phenylobacterium]KQW70972.1 hydrolase [Phenylobacterium sp. Root1277]KQW95870.1 hydrolase [Phenylobacterium sp. Root1290]KRC41655.1 hydrolase [Phenylobacterium sp. Root77]